jgi:hypothetical protein
MTAERRWLHRFAIQYRAGTGKKRRVLQIERQPAFWAQ